MFSLQEDLKQRLYHKTGKGNIVINAYDFSLYFSNTSHNAIFSEIINHTYSFEFYKTGLFFPQYHLLCYGCDKVAFLSSWGCLFQVGHATYQERNQVSETDLLVSQPFKQGNSRKYSIKSLLTSELNRSNQRNPKKNGTRLIDLFEDRTVFTILHITILLLHVSFSH